MAELFRYYMQSENAHFKFARGKPAITGQEFHEYHEILLLLEGDVRLISKNIQYSLLPGSMVLIPKEQFHQFTVAQNDGYLRCIFGFYETPALRTLLQQVMTDVRIIPQPSEQALSIFKTLMKAVQQNLPPEEQVLLLQASIIQLLIDYKLSDYASINSCMTASELTQKTISYINAHIADTLSLQQIAQELNVSVSSVAHHFRKDLNISVYRYISEKRLSTVRQYTGQGYSLAFAASMSGFKDYSSFFRLYKKIYGQSPSGNDRSEKSAASQ